MAMAEEAEEVAKWVADATGLVEKKAVERHVERMVRGRGGAAAASAAAEARVVQEREWAFVALAGSAGSGTVAG